jgi:GntR family transcriptional regulator / MocR family aminotransferase
MALFMRRQCRCDWLLTRSNLDATEGANHAAGVDLHIGFDGRGDLAGQLYRQLRAAILDGRLRAGDGLPPSRELAARIEVSRNTVTAAYDRLTSEGFLAGKVGAGTFVTEGAARMSRHAPRATRLTPRPVWTALDLTPSPAPASPSHDFRVGVPDARLFPAAVWRRLVASELRRPGPRKARYGDPAGLPELREAIARHLGASRSVQASGDDVIVTSGAQQALDIVARVLVEPGATVAVEEPGYPMARLALEAAGGRIAPVPVDGEGIVVSALPASARLVYVTPSHQFPLGMPMSLARRMALLAWAEARGAAIIEDDYDSELRFGGRPLEPLQSLDRAGLVLYIGSFSKVLSPDLRVGYLVAPHSLRPALCAAKLVSDWYTPPATQAALARFIDDGLLARHVRTARREYQARRDRLEAALARELAPVFDVVPSVAGLHLAAELRDDRDDRAIEQAAIDAGLAVRALSRFAISDVPRRGLALGFGAIAASRIDDGVRRLAACVTAVSKRATRSRRRR